MPLVYRHIFPLLLVVGSAGLAGCFDSEEKPRRKLAAIVFASQCCNRPARV